jgi:multidrug efflux system membrane fusion protein
MKSKWSFATLALALAGLATFNFGCHRGGASPAGGHMPAPEVTVAPVEQREVVEWEELTGRTASIEYVEVRPRVSGHIEKVHFESGQMVKKGDVLFVIDSRWYKADAERREAELAMAQARSDNAEREAKRNPQLLASKALSKEEAEARDARYAEARAALLAAKAARDSAQLDLEHTSIRAPIDGRVSRALVTVGNYISGLAGGATLLTTIVSVDPVYVYADMDENALLRFNSLSRSGHLATNPNGQVPVELQLGDESGFPHRGYIESLDNRVDPQSGSIVLRAVLPNPDGRIVPGLFARIRVPSSGRAPVVLVDETAIGTDQAQKYVLSVSVTNTTLYRPVKLGPAIDGKRIVREGLAPGERVIVNGLARVRPGIPVNPVEATATNRETNVAKN